MGGATGSFHQRCPRISRCRGSSAHRHTIQPRRSRNENFRTKLIVTRLFKNSIEAQKINRDIPFVILRVTLIDTDPDLPFNLKLIQFPIRLAFSKTINKSQGQTFDNVGIDLREQCFGHGHLYVALSRVRRQQDLVVYSFNGHSEGCAGCVVLPRRHFCCRPSNSTSGPQAFGKQWFCYENP
jgi:hypothetical protein